jgi:phosphoglycolate phosphatase-like HAD superfamily hydrolase
VLALSEQLTDLAPRESGAAVSEAVQEMLVELQAEAANIHALRPGLIGQVRLARFADAGEEIETLKPQVEALLAQLGKAYAKLCGAGMAHQELARQIREQHGVSAAAGAAFQTRQTVLPVAGFGYTTASAYNLLLRDVGEAMDVAKAEFLAKWSQA